MSSKTVTRAKEVFNKLDTNKDGTLDMKELVLGFKQLGVSEPTKRAHELMKKADLDESYTVDFIEFLYYIEDVAPELLDMFGGDEKAPSLSNEATTLVLDDKTPSRRLKSVRRQHKASSDKIDRRFKIIKKIGEGGFGKTVLAEDNDCLGKKVICKFLLQTDKSSVDMFRKEAEKLLQLSHPNIPSISGYFEVPEDGKYVLVMEYVDGEDLSDVVEKEGPFKMDEVKKVLKVIISVLEYVHGENVIHRDLKAENIMRERGSNRYVLIDFGACAAVQKSDGIAGTIIGTPGYLPPEIATGFASFEADFYSLGATALYLLTGKHPAHLQDTSQQECKFKKTIEELQSAGKIDKVLADLLTALLQVNPQVRLAKLSEDKSGFMENSRNVVAVGSVTDEEAALQALSDDVASPNFKQAITESRSTDAQDAIAKSMIDAGDCDPNVVNCQVKACTRKFNFLHVSPDIIKAFQRVLCDQMVDEFDAKIKAAGFSLDVNRDGVVRDAYRLFVIGAHRFAHTRECLSPKSMHEMRFALLFMACKASMNDLNEKAAEFLAEKLVEAMGGPGPAALKAAQQEDNFSDRILSASSTDRQDALAKRLIDEGDCNPSVSDCNVSDCTARFNFLHISSDAIMAILGIGLEKGLDELQALFRRELGQGININKGQALQLAYLYFLGGVHRFSHTTDTWDIHELHQMRMAFMNQSIRKTLEALVDAASGGNANQRQQVAQQAQKRKTKKDSCVIS